MIDKNGVELVVGKYIVFNTHNFSGNLYKVAEIKKWGALITGKFLVWEIENYEFAKIKCLVSV
jgi:hypothetical protein